VAEEDLPAIILAATSYCVFLRFKIPVGFIIESVKVFLRPDDFEPSAV
jgi:hypothetical protein